MLRRKELSTLGMPASVNLQELPVPPVAVRVGEGVPAAVIRGPGRGVILQKDAKTGEI
jgi:hypothetical protein